MRHRGRLTALFAIVVFVGVMLLMVPGQVDLLRLALPVALLAAGTAGFLTWRWAGHER